MKRIVSYALATLLALSAPLLANPYADKAQARLLQGWAEPDGQRIAALEITLAPGWHTYWRAPGDAGIPPSFDWHGSRNLARVTPEWPRPQIYRSNDMRSIIYTERLLLPLRITPQAAHRPIHLKGRLEIGVCKDICVPLQLDLAATFLPKQRGAVTQIKRARETVPTRSNGLRCQTEAGARGIIVALSGPVAPLGGREEAAVETGDPLIWATEPELIRKGPVLTVRTELVHALGGAFALNRSALRLTLIGERHALDIQGCD